MAESATRAGEFLWRELVTAGSKRGQSQKKKEMSKNALVFQDGSFIVGQSFGADKCISGELVFQTGFKTY
jgi:hypothetical protein